LEYLLKLQYPSGAPQVDDAENWDIGGTGTVPAIVGASKNIDTIGISNDESQANALVGTNNAVWPIPSIKNVPFLLSPSSTAQYAVKACLIKAGFNVVSAEYEGYSSQEDILDKLATNDNNNDNGEKESKFAGLWAPNTYRLLENTATNSSILCTGKDADVFIPGAMIVTEAFAAAQPKTVAAVLAGWLRGIEFINSSITTTNAVMDHMDNFYASFGVQISQEAMQQEVAERPLYGLEEQIDIMTHKAPWWLRKVAIFLDDTGQLVKTGGIPNSADYITPKYMQMVMDDETLQAFAKGEEQVDMSTFSLSSSAAYSLTVGALVATASSILMLAL
jgi:hypothetical protein